MNNKEVLQYTKILTPYIHREATIWDPTAIDSAMLVKNGNQVLHSNKSFKFLVDKPTKDFIEQIDTIIAIPKSHYKQYISTCINYNCEYNIGWALLLPYNELYTLYMNYFCNDILPSTVQILVHPIHSEFMWFCYDVLDSQLVFSKV